MRLRWVRFNLVGIAGVVVQLGVLAALVRWLEAPLTLAIVLAVEAAVIHNFLLHQRWTWKDRPSPGAAETLRRLVRFHAANGLVSLAGNLAITVALTRVGLHPVAANLAAIIVCSCLNFSAGEWLVFRPSMILLVTASTLLTPGSARAQSAEALSGWDAYIRTVDRRHADASAGFFALDERKVEGWRERAKRGEIPMTEVEPPGIPDAKMHHWAGGVFVPNTTVDAVIRRMQAYAGRESEFYEEVKASKLLDRDGDRLRVFMRIERDAGIITATYNTEHAVEYRRIGATRAASRSVSTKIAEIADAGTPQEREKPPGEDHGFLWRLNAYWRFEQSGNGVLIECESVSLSRSVPFIVRPVVGPIANRIARESLARTLRSLRAFLTR
ncbi:MAG TPA: GtrA family protein [Vicinamibacterales bacterium]